jgi:hypothetical protein
MGIWPKRKDIDFFHHYPMIGLKMVKKDALSTFLPFILSLSYQIITRYSWLLTGCELS